MKRQFKKSEYIESNWTTEQDSFLIEIFSDWAAYQSSAFYWRWNY